MGTLFSTLLGRRHAGTNEEGVDKIRRVVGTWREETRWTPSCSKWHSARATRLQSLCVLTLPAVDNSILIIKKSKWGHIG